ncbi:MAG TPA: ABC transporter permease [Terriglobia bacterium]|nr:ABC transporter permease [Terriglobia bacterium]
MSDWLRTQAARFRGLLTLRRDDQDFTQEIDAHLALLTAENVRRGMTPEEARRAALVRLGGVTQLRETNRELRGLPWLETLAQDIRYGLHMLRNSPGFTAVAVLTLALGIGANTAIFSVINAVMLRMLPVQEPERLVQIGFQGRHGAESFVGESFSYAVFKELRERNQAFTDISGFDYWDSFDARLAGTESGGTGQPIKGQLVSANFFSLLGVDPMIGRTFAPDADTRGGDHSVAVIIYALWTRTFARDPGVLGRKVTVDRTPLTIIGVAPKYFGGVNPGRTCDLWALVSMEPQLIGGEFGYLTDPNVDWLTLLGRLKPGVSVEQARANLDVLFQQSQRQQDLSGLSAAARGDFLTHRIVLLPAARGTDYLRKEFQQPLSLLMGMVALVLLIACANVANLLLARANARQREIMIRVAVGAGRRRLVRQLLTESVLLSLIGGAVGMLLAYWVSPILVILMSRGQNQMTLNVHPDLRVLAFTLLIALITGIAFGLAPAMRATRVTIPPGSSRVTTTRTGRSLGRALVVVQVALSLVLVVGAGLLIRTLRNLETLDPGFDSRNVLLFGLDPTRAGYKEERLAEFYQGLLDRLNQQPGVQSASFSFLTPISGGGWDNSIFVEGYAPRPGEDMDTYINAVSPRFFDTLQTPLILGRDFGPQDRAGSPPVAIVNQAMVRRFFEGRNPIGGRFGWGEGQHKAKYEIVGVVGNAKYLSLRDSVPPTAYVCARQSRDWGGVNFEVRTAAGPSAFAPEIRRVLQSVDPRLTAPEVTPFAQQIDQSLYQEKLVSALSGFFGVLALLLACIGLYGIMAYAVARRTNEIGIRLALGAERASILRMVLGEALLLAAVGILIGLPAVWAATRSVASLLYGLKATDPLTVLIATSLLAAVAALAGYLPARRATKVDLMVALRYE